MKLVVSFFSELEEVALKRSNGALKNILNVLDWVQLTEEEKVKLRKIIVDEINGMRRDYLDYFKRTRDAQKNSV
jgi:hypothetical protein